MKFKNLDQKTVEVIFKASIGSLCVDEMEDVMDRMSVRESHDFLRLIKMLTIMRGCTDLLETPENEYPI